MRGFKFSDEETLDPYTVYKDEEGWKLNGQGPSSNTV